MAWVCQSQFLLLYAASFVSILWPDLVYLPGSQATARAPSARQTMSFPQSSRVLLIVNCNAHASVDLACPKHYEGDLKLRYTYIRLPLRPTNFRHVSSKTLDVVEISILLSSDRRGCNYLRTR